MVWVVLSDISLYTISNRLNGVILLLFIAGIFFLPIKPVPALLTGGAMLAVGLAMFALGLMGGGDIKLLVVLSLWTGWDASTLQFIFLTAIVGGALVAVVLLARFLLPPIWFRLRPKRNLPRILVRKQPVPYGVAIAGAFGWLLYQGSIPALS